MEKVYIIVLNYNNWKDTICCLESLLSLDYNNFQIILVDNFSTDNSVEKILSWANNEITVELSDFYLNKIKKFSIDKTLEIIDLNNFKFSNSKILLLKNNENNGYAAGNNIGINYAKFCNDFEYLWILNNDVFVENTSLSFLVEKSKKNKDTLLGNKIFFFYEPNVLQTIGIGYHNYLMAFSWLVTNTYGSFKTIFLNILKSFFCFKFVYGASVFFSKELISKLNYKFTEDYFLYFEEQDTAIQLLNKGCNIDTCEEAVIYHKSGNTINSNRSNKKSTFVDYYFNRNKILFTQKYFPKVLFVVKIFVFITAIRRCVQGYKNNAIQILKVIGF